MRSTLATPVLLALLVAAPIPVSAKKNKPKVAVVPLSSTGRGAAKVAAKTTTGMAKRLSKGRAVQARVLPQGKAARLQTCLQVADCVQRLCRGLGVDYLIAGHVTRVGATFNVDLRVVDKNNGEVAASTMFHARSAGTAKGSGARVAAQLIQQARQGVRVASATASRASDAELARAPASSESEARAASVVLEERDVENPLLSAAERKKKEEAARRKQEQAERSKRLAQADLGPIMPVNGGATAVAVATKPAAPHADLFSRRYMTGWVIAGTGIAALGAGIGFGVMTKVANTEAHDAQYQGEAYVARDSARKNALVANVLYGVGGAALAASTLLLYLEYRKDMAEQQKARDSMSLDVNVAHGGGGVMTLKGTF